MKYRRKETKNDNSDSDNSSDEEILENTNNNLPTINNEERYFLKKIFPILPSSTSSPKSKLIFSIILDIIGFVAQAIPIFGITIWPSLSTYLIYKVYGPGLHLSLSFIEETVPGLGFIPTATICFFNEKFNLVSRVNRYMPTRYIRWIKNIISFFKTVSYGVIIFILYKLFGHFMSSSSSQPQSSNR